MHNRLSYVNDCIKIRKSKQDLLALNIVAALTFLLLLLEIHILACDLLCL